MAESKLQTKIAQLEIKLEHIEEMLQKIDSTVTSHSDLYNRIVKLETLMDLMMKLIVGLSVSSVSLIVVEITRYLLK